MSDLSNFNPNSIGLYSNTVFGLPFTEETASVVLLPVPWEVTVSYRTGTAMAPMNIFESSLQVDLFDAELTDVWKKGIYMQEANDKIMDLNDDLREKAEELLDVMANGENVHEHKHYVKSIVEINAGCAYLCDWVYESAAKLLENGKKVGLVGGDHSTPYGLVQALADHHKDFGILQIDAHADLREAYEGFTFSHASIMYNILKNIPEVKKLVQVGIRDYCDEELQLINDSNGRIKTFFDADIKAMMYEGTTWGSICRQIVDELPQNLYISFDIDGLDVRFCPNTGTPVPGGFDVDQIFYLFRTLHKSGKKIIGFDLNEVSCGDQGDTIDTITGARVLYKLCCYLAMQG